MSKIKLKPCPFCGEPYVAIQEDTFAKCDTAYYIKCSFCGARGPRIESSPECGFGYEYNEAEKMTSEAWNNRKGVIE